VSAAPLSLRRFFNSQRSTENLVCFFFSFPLQIVHARPAMALLFSIGDA
jgi:hypothetical protein